MRFCLIDRVVACDASRCVTLKVVSNAEEYLGDHFPGFPVLPGVMTLEACVQATRHWASINGVRERVVLGEARALKYGALVRPGDCLRVEVSPSRTGTGGIDSKARALLVTPDALARDGSLLTVDARPASLDALPVAASGRLTLRPVRPVPAPALARG